jgi:hypothetical protein
VDPDALPRADVDASGGPIGIWADPVGMITRRLDP